MNNNTHTTLPPSVKEEIEGCAQGIADLFKGQPVPTQQQLHARRAMRTKGHPRGAKFAAAVRRAVEAKVVHSINPGAPLN